MGDDNVPECHPGWSANAAKLKTDKELDKQSSWFHTTRHMVGPDQQHSYSVTNSGTPVCTSLKF